jgi:hypothetical protein
MILAELRATQVLAERDLEPLTDDALGEDIRELRAIADSIEAIFSRMADAFRRRGGHLADGHPSAVSWLAGNCRMSATSAADRLCVGKELDSVPGLSQSVGEGEVGFQSAAAVCHLMEQLGEKREGLDQEALLDWTKQFSVAQVRTMCKGVRRTLDPEGAELTDEEDFERRWLKISPLADGMHAVDGVLDAVGAAAVKSALDALASRGGRDRRKRSQRMADALVELAHHGLDSGVMPAKNSVKPHLNVTTTLEGIQGLPGGASIEGVAISQNTLERVACDCTISRVMLADSVVTDVGRATRTISPGTRRALKARDKHCRFPGCDRPASWTTPHHIEFWSRGGPTNLRNLLSLCYYHHRLVHEGGWQVVKAGGELRFIPPERPPLFMPHWRARGPGMSWAA